MAFHGIHWTKLLEIIKNIGINWRERRLIRHLYTRKIVKRCLNQGEADSVEIGRGVRLRCYMSPILFKLYGEYLIKEAFIEIRYLKIEEGLLIRSDLRMIRLL